MEKIVTDKHHSTTVNGSVSNERMDEFEVPQDTVLGSILFNIYLNNFVVPSPGEIITFADDIAIFYAHDDWEPLKRMVKTDSIRIKQ